jgi:hypothetical protein
MGRHDERKNGSLKTIAPFETVKTHLELDFSSFS